QGWSDTMADWTEKTSAAVPDYVMGQYVINDAAGIRSHLYSTSATVNPLRYSSLRTLTEVHANPIIGEVWANIQHNVYAALVTAHGFSTTAKTNPAGTEGNIFLHLFIDALFIDALALQPCNPTFLTARTTWIQADTNRYTGANTCVLWRAFASRGLGTNAANHADCTSVPARC
ncbi:peptidase M36, partial [Mycena sp. CBHHK59/15]